MDKWFAFFLLNSKLRMIVILVMCMVDMVVT